MLLVVIFGMSLFAVIGFVAIAVLYYNSLRRAEKERNEHMYMVEHPELFQDWEEYRNGLTAVTDERLDDLRELVGDVDKGLSDDLDKYIEERFGGEDALRDFLDRSEERFVETFRKLAVEYLKEEE